MLVTLSLQPVAASVVIADVGRAMLSRRPWPGMDASVFELVKLRTMRHQDHITDADRLARVGPFLRSTSLGEPPTFWNVLKGEMSLFGPRPLLVQYLERYTPEPACRHEVLRGVAGLAGSALSGNGAGGARTDRAGAAPLRSLATAFA